MSKVRADVNKRVLRTRERLQRYLRIAGSGRRIPAETLLFVAGQYRTALVDFQASKGADPELALENASKEVERLFSAEKK